MNMINNPASLLEKQDQSRKHVIKGNIIKFDQINNEIFSICIPEKGFNIYSNSDNIPQLILKKEFPEEGNVRMVSILHNIFAIVFYGELNRVKLWDDEQGRFIAKLIFKSNIRELFLQENRLTVILDERIFVYKIDKIISNEIDEYACGDYSNKKGIAQVVNNLLIVPSEQEGCLLIIDLITKNEKLLRAHKNAIQCICSSSDSRLLATASERGTVIRIFDTRTNFKIHEFRRGSDPAKIYHIAFNEEITELCVASDTGTVHIFNLTRNKSHDEYIIQGRNKQHSLAFMKPLLPNYFSSQWSFAKFTIPSSIDCHYKVGFVKNNCIMVITNKGEYFRFLFDPEKGGEAIEEIKVDLYQLN